MLSDKEIEKLDRQIKHIEIFIWFLVFIGLVLAIAPITLLKMEAKSFDEQGCVVVHSRFKGIAEGYELDNIHLGKTGYLCDDNVIYWR